MTIGITLEQPGLGRGVGGRRRRSRTKRIVIGLGGTCLALIMAAGLYVGYTIYKIDHAVHHVGVPASILARGKNDLLAVVRGPDHSEEIYLFHATGGHTNVLLIPSALAITGPDGHKVPIRDLSIHSPAPIISGLSRMGIPVSEFVGVDLHMVNPNSSLGRLATGKISVTSLISNPTGTSSLIQEVASHVYLGPHTPTSALLSLMHVPTKNPISVPTATDPSGHVVLADSFNDVMRSFL
jgi:hypothetical protein